MGKYQIEEEEKITCGVAEVAQVIKIAKLCCKTV